MSVYYTVDSSGELFPPCIVPLGNYFPKQIERATFLKDIYPSGLSMHGYNYFYNPGPIMSACDDESAALLIGLIFELVRRSHFPTKPSRYQSLFACQKVDEAKQFRNLLADERCDDEIRVAAIYEVLTDDVVHCGDMRLLNDDCPVLELYRRAHLYWSGKTVKLKEGQEPFWEVLIPLPVLVGRQIPE